MAPSLKVFWTLVLKDLDQLPNKIIHINPAFTSGLNYYVKEKIWSSAPPIRARGIVVLDKEKYIKEMSRILDDSSMYGLMPKDPTLYYKRALVELVNEGLSLGILDRKEKEFFNTSSSKNPRHILPS